MITLRSTLTILLCFACSASASTASLSSYLVKNEKDLQSLSKAIKKTRSAGTERTWLQWQYVLNAPQLNYVSKALEVLNEIEKSKQTLIGQDQIQITKGRLLFQKGKFDDAVTAYKAVPKTSEFWFEALEEEAWSYIRLNEPAQATAKLSTLLSPVFATWVGPETYFAANYNSLKICDYNSIFKNGKTFKARQKSRLAGLEQLAKEGTNDQLSAASSKLENGETHYLSFAKEAEVLPRFFWRDEILRQHVKTIQTLKAKKANAKEITQARANIPIRMQALAKAEISEYRTVVQKLQIIEAEVIQRLYLDESLKGERPEIEIVKRDANQLTFLESDELWIDEIDKKEAQVKICPQLKEANL